MNANATATANANAMETPPSPLALFVRLACDPAGAHTPAFAWHSFERDPVTWSYARTYRAAAAAASKVWKVVDARGDPPPRVSPLQTSPEHRAHCVGACVSEGPGLLLLTLAVGLCGCAFVPLSKHDPPRRLAAAMRDAKVSAVVVDDDDDARRAVAEALETLRDAPGPGTEDGNGKNGLVDVLRLSETFDARAWEDGTEDGTLRSAAIGETESEFPDGALVAALADLDLDTCIERHPERISHVFFTSGSTGTPKGCVATRGALAWFAAGKRETHRLDASSVVLVASPHVFDPSLGDVYASLAAGGCVALCPEAKLVSHLGACLAATAATHLTATPTALGSVCLANVSPRIEKNSLMKDSLMSPSRATTNLSRKSACVEKLFPALRVVALGGEPTPRTLAETWVGLVPTLANTYGVTECCVYQTFSKIEAGDAESRRRLGDAFPGVRAIHAAPPGDDPANAVDDDASVSRNKNKTHDTLAELWLAGPQVGLGYAGDPALTSARFRVVVGADGNEERLFRTGDVTKRGEGNGGRVLLGRGDGQVKIRGRRVELGEIETAMLECLRDVVRDVAVTVTGKDGDGGSDGALVAWAVPLEFSKRFENVSKTHAETSTDSYGLAVRSVDDAFETPTATTCDAMRWVLASRLPAYMLPSRFAFVRALPRTASGKTARAAMARRGVPPPPTRLGPGAPQRAFPRRERVLGALVKAAWSRELGVPPHAIERASRFAELGGDSMVAARVCRGVHAATRAAGAAAEAAGAHGEFLTGALAPASLAGNVSLGTFVSRVAADLGRADLGTDLGTDLGFRMTDSDEDEDDETRGGDASEDASFDETGSDERSVSAGVSLLYRAAREDAPGIAMALVRRGVPVDGWRDSRSGSPAREGASVFTKKKTNLFVSSPLHAACGAGAEAAAAVLLEGGALPRARARRGATPLHLAAGAARPFSAEGLRRVLARADEGVAAKGSALAFLDDDKQSALHYAARAGAAAGAVEWLMDTAETLQTQKRLGFGVRVAFSEWRDVWGRTAMHWAALNGHGAVVAVLLKKGASPKVADARGETPVALAERRALCSARERPDGERASRWGDIATLLGGAGTTKHLKKSLSAPNK